MKSEILKRILQKITKRIIKKYNPLIVAVTGSVGKTSTKDAIYTTLSRYKNTRKSSKNLNTEIGAPLVFLGAEDPGRNFKEWFFIILRGLGLIFKRKKNYPEIIVMEMAADKPGDIKYLTDFIKPHIGVVTAIGETPVHLEFFKDVNEVVKEKSLLAKHTKKGGTVLLNADDGRVFQMKGRANTKTKTFGFSDRAEVRAKNLNYIGKEQNPEGVEVLIVHDTEEHMVKLPNVFDKGTVYSVLASIGVGLSVGIPIYRLVESAKKIKPPRGRMRIIEGDNFKMIDSSYNAAPESTELAVKTLEKLPANRKLAVLGDMLELGNQSEKAHRKIGKIVNFLSVIVTVGKDSELIGRAAKENGFTGDIFHFKNSEDAVEKLKKIIRKDDLILVKGSQSIRTEKIIEELMVGDPEEELVRQYYPWKNNGKN